jgi:hypothetical protein
MKITNSLVPIARSFGGLQIFNHKFGDLNTKFKLAGIVLVLIVVTNVCSYFYGLYGWRFGKDPNELYLLDRASIYVSDIPLFENKVRQVAKKLDIPPEWLMSVMYSESRFNAKAENFKGSGAIGLIQFMPTTAKDMGTSVQYIKQLEHIDQLEYVYRYLQAVRVKYGEYRTLTDLYLAILYPRAREGEMCYSLYENPTKAYKQNVGLDEDKDGKVTVNDIDKRMRRVFGPAYVKEKIKINYSGTEPVIGAE